MRRRVIISYVAKSGRFYCRASVEQFKSLSDMVFFASSPYGFRAASGFVLDAVRSRFGDNLEIIWPE